MKTHCSTFAALALATTAAFAQVTTPGFLNLPRAEAPGTLLSHPVTNGSEPIGRTTSINYLNGWIIVGAEVPGSRAGSDLQMRVYDISNPATPVRRLPSDFLLNYPSNSFYFGNYGWDAHGTAKWENLLLNLPMRVASFGGIVERGGTNGIPDLVNLPLDYNRSAMAGPWSATLLWYNEGDEDIVIRKAAIGQNGNVGFRTLCVFDHVGAFGGGDWHPMIFGDLLIMARSGQAGNDGVVVYRLAYQNMEDGNPANDAVTPQFVGSLQGGFQGYWPNLFSDGTGLYVIGSTSDILIGADISQATHPAGSGAVTLAASMVMPGFSNASYPVYQDNFGFIHNRKVDMTRFLAGDANPVVLTLNEVNPPRPAGAPALPGGALVGVNTSQISLPLGNLWLTGGYPIPTFNQGMGVWVHQQAPDTTPPRVSFHIPQVGRQNYPRSAPLSFLVHEHTRSGGPRNGVDFTVRPVGVGEVLGAFVTGFLIHDFSGNMTFTPDAPLAADTTYQVDFLSNPATQVGFRDAAGNYIEPYSYRFSTGGSVNAPAPPAITSVAATLYQPAPGQQTTVSIGATGAGPLEYRLNFDGSWTAWSNTASADFTYASAGRPRVLVQVRDAAGNVVNDSVRLLVITPPVGPAPTQNSSLAIGNDAGVRRVWSVNPDADTVTVINAATGAKELEIPVGTNPRNVARDANGRYWVTCHRSDEIRVLNADGTPFSTIAVPYGSAPFGIAPSPDGSLLYVTLQGSARIHRYTAANSAAAPLSVTTFATPRAIAISGNGARVFITRFLSPDLHAEVAELNATLGLVRTLTLAGASTLDSGDRAAGIPNYLTGIAISPDGTRAAVVSKHDNTNRGTLFGVGNLTHETTVRAVVSFLDLATTNAEIPHTRRDFDNSDSPSAVTYTPLGDTLLVTHQGNNRVVGIDALNLAPLVAQIVAGSTETSPAVITLDLDTGLAPQGLLVDAASGRLFTQDFMGRSVTVRNAAPFLVENRTSLPVIATTASVATELLSANVLLGKRIFYNAADPRMSADSYISCASCHIDGGHDGRVWDFTGRGEGLRRTTDLRGRSGTGHGNVHWTGNFDEIQDFEHDIRGAFGGTGFLPLNPQQFASLHPTPATGKSGLSADLDALAAYVASLAPEHTPRSPTRNTNGTFTTAAARGQAVFTAQNCASCHSGNSHTNSTLGPVATHPLFNVGTQSGLSGARLGGSLTGIDVPTLDGLHASRVFLHHGLAATLEEVFPFAGGTLFYGATAQPVTTVNPNAVGTFSDNPLQGGGGTTRGLFGGTAISIGNEAGAATPPAIRFSNVDGGAGGTARIALRYLRQYNGGTAVLRVNGVDQTPLLTVFQQFPDNNFHISGWRWLTRDVSLNPGATNTIEIARGDGNLFVNVLHVASASTLATAQPHRVVQSLSVGDRADLLAYLRQLDGRDANGVPFPPPAPPAPTAPSVVVPPASQLLAVGNPLDLSVAVSGSGPFTFQWRRGATLVGTNSAEFGIPAVQPADAGSYTVEVTNAQGSITSSAAIVTVNPALDIATAALPVTTLGRVYSTTLTATGGTSARTWSITSGVLPAGMNFSPGGTLSGTPTVAARAVLTFRVADASGFATRSLLLDVRPIGGFSEDPDLVLHYTFDEGSGTQIWDVAPTGSNHATTVTGTTWTTSGRFGGAYGAGTASSLSRFFPANQGDLNFLPRGDAFTMSVWVRTTFAAGGYRTVLGKDDGVVSGYVQHRLWTTNTMTTVQGINGGAGGNQPTAPALNDGQWHLLTMVNFLNGATWQTRVYYDGAQVSQFNTGAGVTTAGLLRIGDTSLGGNGWNGQLDDLRIYRRALTQPEIATLFNPLPLQSYDTWMSALANPPNDRGLTADPDFDGFVSLLEYALGTHPNDSASATAPVLSRTSTHVSLSYQRLRSDLIYTVEASTDLLTWSSVGIDQDNVTPIGQTATAALPITPTTPNIFLRLRVTEP